MKKYRPIIILLAVFFASCVGSGAKMVLHPDSVQDGQIDQVDPWQIIESQDGPGEEGIPEWVHCYYQGELQELESGDSRYLFVGKSRGDNLNALQQWSNNFSVEQDLPRLIAQRVERRLIASASLYPDDEYGEYFETLMKKVSDSEFPGAAREQDFWVKRRIAFDIDEDPAVMGLSDEDAVVERYEFLVLMSIDKVTLQNQLQEMMMGIRTRVSPTREQTAAINKIRQSFFEGF